MIKNYIIVAIRNLLRQKWATIISVVGLSTAMALFTVIMLYVWYERSFDEFHEKVDRIYFIEGEKWTNTPAPLANILLDEFSEIENVVRIDYMRNFFWVGNDRDNLIGMSDVLVADSSIFKVFSFNIIYGDAKNPFPTWNSMAISQSAARLHFGDDDPIGKTLTLNKSLNYNITAVYQDLPKNSSIKAQAVIPFYGLNRISGNEDILNIWGNWNYHTWILVRDNGDSKAMLERLRERIYKIFTEELGWRSDGVQLLQVRPFKGMYLDGKDNDLPKGNTTQLVVLSAIAFFILLIACINFVNLSTAKAIRRAKEIGLRKTVGASRSKLIVQFMIEVLLLTIISLVFTIGLTEVFLPEFNKLLVSELSVKGFGIGKYILVLISTLLGVTLLAGTYPALFLTSYSPIRILRGEITKGAKGNALRRSLIVVQIVVAIVLAISSIVVFRQMNYMKTFDMGIKREQIVYFSRMGLNKNLLRESLLKIPGIDKVSFTTGVPGSIRMSWGRVVDGKDVHFTSVIADPEYLEILGVEFIKGRNFSYDFSSDSLGAIIFNERAIRNFEIDDPLEKWMGTGESKSPIIGVVKDFHFKSLHHELEPLGIFFGDIDWAHHCMIKISGSATEIMAQVKEAIYEFNPAYPFSYKFLNDRLAAQYQKEERLSKSFTYFTLIAIIIACLGLFAMASYAAEQRVKEIGIRKVLGADMVIIVWLMSKDFGILVLISNLIGWPIAYIAMSRWLESFPERIHPEPMVFIVVGIASFVLMQLTILYKAISAARINPAVTLKYE